MKRLYVLALSLLLTVGLAGLTACGGNDTTPPTVTETPAPPTPAPSPTPSPTPPPAEEVRNDDDVVPVGNISPQIIGIWSMTSTDDPVQVLGLQHGWDYDMYFFDDGTGIEWWFSPDTGWHEVSNFTWSASSGRITLTYSAMDFDVIEHYLGTEAADLMAYAIGVPITGTYSIAGNMLTLSIGGLTYVYQKNVASEIIGEWHMTSSEDPLSISGLESGWGYDIYFLGDNTGIEWWYSPETGWHEVFHFMWSASSGQVILTYIAMDFDVVEHYLGSESAVAMYSALGIPFMGGYNVTGDTLTITVLGITSVYERN